MKIKNMNPVAGGGLYETNGVFNVNVDSEYLKIDPIRDSITAGAKGLARLTPDNTFHGKNTFQDIICTSIDVVSDASKKTKIDTWKPNPCDVSQAIRGLRPCTFSYTKHRNRRVRVGLIANEVENAISTHVGLSTVGGTVDYIQIFNLLLLGVQNLRKELDESIERIRILERVNTNSSDNDDDTTRQKG